MDNMSPVDAALFREIESMKANGTLFPERNQTEPEAVQVNEADVAVGGIANAASSDAG